MKKYNTDFTSITLDTQDKITAAVEELNCTPIMICHLTNHPEDECLYVVLAQYTKPLSPHSNMYCVWESAVRGEEASLFYGHYGVSFKTAMKIISEKVRDLNKEEC